MSSKTEHTPVSKDPWYVNPERYLELKHFCKQYPIWLDAYTHLDGLSQLPPEEMERFNPTCSVGVVRARYKKWIDIVDTAARAAATNLSPELKIYIRRSVTEDRSYEYMTKNFGVDLRADEWRTYIHKFYYILSTLRE